MRLACCRPALDRAAKPSVLLGRCPAKPAFSAVKRPARPYKSPIQNRFTMQNADGA